MAERRRKVVVVGAGVAGLVSAMELAHGGCEVTVVERAEHVGGKILPVRLGDHEVDTGPTVLTMLWVFEQVFAATGASLADYVTPRKLDRIARHVWSDGTQLDLFTDLERSACAIDAAFGTREAQNYITFCEKNQRLYDMVREPFLSSDKPTWLDVVKPKYRFGLDWATKIEAHRTMMASLTRSFREPKLRQLFGRYATYCGSSPWLAPATLNVIAHVEQQGVWVLQGGMSSLARALQRRGEELGVTFRLGQWVQSAHADGASTNPAGGWRVALASGEELTCDAVVFNGDVAALGALVGNEGTLPAYKPEDRSLSAWTWAGVGMATGVSLAKHTVFFSDDYHAEFEDLFAHRRIPLQPTIYVCAFDRDEHAAGDRPPRARERFFLIVNAPALGDKGLPSDQDVEQCTQSTLERLAQCGLYLDCPNSVVADPRTYHQRFAATGGALYGPASHGMMSAFRRSGARVKMRSGRTLYVASGSGHPGAGVPMAALSGRLGARAVLSDFGLMQPSR
jgi:1-hydroxycarotenoid 3,4-desaturase